MRIKTINEFEKYLFQNFDAYISSVEEVNTFEHYSLIGDREHDYTLLKKVYKVMGQFHFSNDYEEVFILLFSKNDKIMDAKVLGAESDKLEKMWRLVEWEE